MITIEEGKSYVTNGGDVMRDAHCVRAMPTAWRLKAEDGETRLYTWDGLHAAISDGKDRLDLAGEYVEPEAEPAPARGVRIEEGKSYATNSGGVMRHARSVDNELYPWALDDENGVEQAYTADGSYVAKNRTTHYLDLAREVNPAEAVPIDPATLTALSAERRHQAAITNTPRPGEPKDARDRAARAVFKGDFSMPLEELSKLAAGPDGPLVANTEPKTIRHKVLDAAKKAVAVRNEAYGTPEDNFERIARRWTVHLMNIGKLPINAFEIGFVISPADVALMLADVKVARIENDPKHVDSWIDLAGYAACGAECENIAIDENPLSDK